MVAIIIAAKSLATRLQRAQQRGLQGFQAAALLWFSELQGTEASIRFPEHIPVSGQSGL
jgi:hypothetical protein